MLLDFHDTKSLGATATIVVGLLMGFVRVYLEQGYYYHLVANNVWSFIPQY